MENNLETKLAQTILEKEELFKDDELFLSYQLASEEFDELIKNGFAKKRESNLMNLVEAHLHRILPNTYNLLNQNQLPINLELKSNFNY